MNFFELMGIKFEEGIKIVSPGGTIWEYENVGWKAGDAFGLDVPINHLSLDGWKLYDDYVLSGIDAIKILLNGGTVKSRDGKFYNFINNLIKEVAEFEPYIIDECISFDYIRVCGDNFFKEIKK